MGELVIEGNTADPGRAQRPLTRLWQHRWLNLMLTIGLVALTGLVVGLTMLLAPAVYIVAVELVRLNAVGPTVDAIRLNNTFGILAFILGRGFHGLVGLLPMILGVEAGVLVTGQMGSETASDGRMRKMGGSWERPFSLSRFWL